MHRFRLALGVYILLVLGRLIIFDRSLTISRTASRTSLPSVVMLSISSPILLSPRNYWPSITPCRPLSPRLFAAPTYTQTRTLKRKNPAVTSGSHDLPPSKKLCTSSTRPSTVPSAVDSDKGAASASPGSAPLAPNIPLNPIIPATPERRDPKVTMSTFDQTSSQPIAIHDASTMPPTLSPRKSHSSSPSQTLPPFLTMRRQNPKKLSLSLFVPPTSPMSTESTPFTPGPPRTPALSMSVGRGKTGRPSLLSLITRESPDDVPPTPGRPRPKRSRAQSDTTDATPYPLPAGSRSAHPTSLSFAPISENPEPDFGIARETTTPTSMSSSSSLSGSTPSTSCSPPIRSEVFPRVSNEPYANGPVEVIPGVFLGSEEATYDLNWAKGSRIRILNVASEIDDPFVNTHTSVKGKERQGEKLSLAHYTGDRDIEYCHLSWSHGEEKLADLPAGVQLDDLLEGEEDRPSSWGFWHAIRWLETARRQGVPVLIQ